MAERVSLAGIGMTGEYVPNPEVKKIHIEAPNYINRLYDGTGAFDMGFPNMANDSNGFTEIDSGMRGRFPEANAAVVGTFFDPDGVLISGIGNIPDALDSHLNLFKGTTA